MILMHFCCSSPSIAKKTLIQNFNMKQITEYIENAKWYRYLSTEN